MKKRLVIEINKDEEKEIQLFKSLCYLMGKRVREVLMKLIKNFNLKKEKHNG